MFLDPQEANFGHIYTYISFGPYMGKFEFWSKIMILEIFNGSHIGVALRHKWWKMLINTFFTFFESLKHFQIPWMMLYCTWKKRFCIIKNHDFERFFHVQFPYNSPRRKIVEIMIFEDAGYGLICHRKTLIFQIQTWNTFYFTPRWQKLSQMQPYGT